MQAKKSLGQNFLIDNNIIDKIVNEVEATEGDLIIEIGPGRGALTKKLKAKGAKIIAYELDNDLKPVLNLLEDNNTRVIYKDFLTTNINDDIKDIKYNNLFIVGNLPYYITTPIIEHIINQSIYFKKFTIMIQKEVADRFLATPGNKEYGYFTLLLDYYFNIKKVCSVSKYAFNPVPKVESTVLSFCLKDNNYNLDVHKYMSFLKQAFSQKRKTLRNNLKEYNWNSITEVLDKHNISQTVRAEEISQDIFIEIFESL